jgi:hypothetical protein
MKILEIPLPSNQKSLTIFYFNKSLERIVQDFRLLRIWQMQDRLKKLAKLQILSISEMSGEWNETFMGSQRNGATGEIISSLIARGSGSIGTQADNTIGQGFSNFFGWRPKNLSEKSLDPQEILRPTKCVITKLISSMFGLFFKNIFLLVCPIWLPVFSLF